VQEGRARAGPGGGGQGQVDGAEAETDVPLPGAQQQLERAGQRGGVVQHALELVAGRALERAQLGDPGEPVEGVGHAVGAGAAVLLIRREHCEHGASLRDPGSCLMTTLH
jgi:hypothetical protein